MILDQIKPVTIRTKKLIVTLPSEDYEKYSFRANKTGPQNGETLQATINNRVCGAAQRSYEADREIRQIKRLAKRKKTEIEEDDKKRIEFLQWYLLPEWTIEKRELIIEPGAKDDFLRVTNESIFEAQGVNKTPLPINWNYISP